MFDRQAPSRTVAITAAATCALALSAAAPAAAQSFTATATPNPLTLTVGGPAGTVRVETTPDPLFREDVTYGFVGLPSFLRSGPSQVTRAPAYPTLTFAFSLGAGAVPGTYAGTLRGTSRSARVEVPFTVAVEPRPSFTAAVSPNPLTMTIGRAGGTVRVTTSAEPRFTAPIAYSFSGLPGFVVTGGTRTATGPAYAPADFPFSLGPAAAPGTYDGTLVGTGGGTREEVPFRVVVRPRPAFTAAAAPDPSTLTIGGSGGTVRVTTSADPAFTGPIAYSFTGLPGFVATGGTRTATGPAYAPVRFPFSLRPGAVPGVYDGTLRGVGGGVTFETPFRVRVAAEPTFSAAVEPERVALASGGPPVAVAVSTTADDGFDDVVTYRPVGFPAFVRTGGSLASAPPAYPTVVFSLSLGPEAVPGTYRGAVAAAVGGEVRQEVPLTVVVEAPVPRVVQTTPRALAAGARSQVVRLTGRDFAPGATVASDRTAVVVEGARVVSPELAEVTVSVRPDASPGVVRLILTNPSGPSTPQGGRLAVLTADSPAAPLAVTAAVVVFPRPGTHVGREDRLYPQGLLTTAGSGPVAGSWRLDGAVFDRFTVHAVAGRPLPVHSRVPLPRLGAGDHELVLEVTHPGRISSPPVVVIQTVRRASGLRALAPAEQAVVGGSPLAFEWTLVPGAAAYQVEVESPSLRRPLRRVTPETRWEPAASVRAELAGAVARWRVRALFPGEVRGEPTAWRELAVLAEDHRLSVEPPLRDPDSGLWRLSWSGGSPGLVYRVSLLPAGGGTPLHRALTMDQHLVPPAGLLAPGTRYRVEVEALGPDGESLGGAEPSEIQVSADGGGGAGFAHHDPSPGRGAAASAGYRFAAQRASGGSDPAGGAPADGRFLDGRYEIELALDGHGGDEPREADESRLTLSGQGAARRPGGSAKSTADLSWSRELDGGGPTEQESESWLARAGGRAGPVRGEAGAGYGTPTFLAGTELLAAGLARGGVQGSLGFPGAVRFAYYRSFDPELGNVAGGVFGVEQDLQAGALELGGDDRRVLLRVVGLEVEQPPAAFDAGGEGRVFGLFGRLRLGGGASLVIEGARGDFEPGLSVAGAAAEGDAYRLGLEGAAGSWTYGLALRRVEASFVNPANRGLTLGGRSDRDVVELTLGGSFGSSRLGARFERIEGGEDSAAPPATVDALRLEYSTQVGPALELAFEGAYASTRADAEADLFLPPTDRRDWGLTASAVASLGALQLAPSASVEIQEDLEDPTADVTTTDLSLSAFAATSGGLSLSGSLVGTRIDADPFSGRTDTLVAFLQPAWEIAAASLRLEPFLSYTETTNELLALDTTTEQYLLTVSWNPPWLGSLLALELTGDWSRTRDALFPEEADGFVGRYVAAVVLRRGGERRLPRPRPPAPPPYPPPRVTPNVHSPASL